MISRIALTALGALALAIGFALVAPSAQADVVTLASGEEVVGRVVTESAREVVVEVATGLVRIERAQVLEVVRETARAEAYEGWAAAAAERARRVEEERIRATRDSKDDARRAVLERERARAPTPAARPVYPPEDPLRLWEPDAADPALEAALPRLGPRPAPRDEWASGHTIDDDWLRTASKLPAMRGSGPVTVLAPTEADAARAIAATLAARARIAAWTGEATLAPPLIVCAVPTALWPLLSNCHGVTSPPSGPGGPSTWIIARLDHPRFDDEIIPHEVAHALTQHAIGGKSHDVEEALAVMCEPRALFEERIARARADVLLPAGGARFMRECFSNAATHDDEAAMAAFLLARGGGRERLLRLARRRIDFKEAESAFWSAGDRLSEGRIAEGRALEARHMEAALRDIYGFPSLAAARTALLAWLRARPAAAPDPEATAGAPRR